MEDPIFLVGDIDRLFGGMESIHLARRRDLKRHNPIIRKRLVRRLE